jgi:amino acid adenylation domain-containing protein
MADHFVDFVPFRKEDVEQSIPERFESQARAHPERLAVKSGRRELTYSQLNRLANRIARRLLLERGEGEETVALLFQPGAGLAAAILGALKAGKIYVAVDPSDPPERLGPMLDDSGAGLVLTDEENVAHSRAWETPGRRVLSIEVNESEIEGGASSSDPGLELSPGRLAYVYYTSGSTGRPKGVADSHRNVLHNVLRYTNSLRIDAADRLTLIQRPSFSGSVSNVFSALLNGASVFPFDLREEGIDGLARRIREERITIYHSVPAIFRHVFASAAAYPDVRIVRLEGDRATWKDVELFRRRFGPRCLLVNGLGATETGLSRQFFVHPDTPESGSVLPVGWATEGVECTVTDESGRELPRGEVGEIAVRSAYLSAGYWNRSDLTAAAFFPDPERKGSRIYRSGDLGRMRADGCLEHLGRRNLDLKVRGFRVEVEAVEAALLAIAGVEDAAVGVREEENEDARVLAWVVAKEEAMPSAGALRRALAPSIPEHSLPSAFIRIDALPLDANGKVDRRRLPDPGGERPSLDEPFAPPRSACEEIVAGVWREVLGLSRVGVHDDFFDLGGDSLKAIRVINRLRSRLGVDVPVRVMFRKATIARIASDLESLVASNGMP